MIGANARPCVVLLGATGSASASVPYPQHDGAPKSPQHWQSQCHPAAFEEMIDLWALEYAERYARE
jgi:hypothetical protein